MKTILEIQFNNKNFIIYYKDSWFVRIRFKDNPQLLARTKTIHK